MRLFPSALITACVALNSEHLTDQGRFLRAFSARIGEISEKITKSIGGGIVGTVPEWEADDHGFAATMSATYCDSRESVLLTDLKRGDSVLSNYEMGKVMCSPIIGSDRVLSPRETRMIEIGLDADSSITMTPDHLIYIFKDGETRSVPASSVQLDDQLLLNGVTPSTVVSVQPTLAYATAPHTRNGKMIVNGILSSTLTSGTKPQFLELLDDLMTSKNINDPDMANQILETVKSVFNPFVHYKSNAQIMQTFPIGEMIDVFQGMLIEAGRDPKLASTLLS